LTDKRTRNTLVPVCEAHSRFRGFRNDLSATNSLQEIRSQALLCSLRRLGEDTKALTAASIDALVDQLTAGVENMQLDNQNENKMNVRSFGALRALYTAKRMREKETETGLSEGRRSRKKMRALLLFLSRPQ